MHKLITAAGVATILSIPAAYGQSTENPRYPQQEPAAKQSDKMDHRKMAEDEFKSLDQNSDGKITQQEIPSGSPVAAQFDQLDANKDGSLSKREFAKHHEQMGK
jgi:Ca2+-binding EF-hand superfamily protein